MHLIQKVFIALSGTVMVIAAWRGASAVSAASFIVMLCSVESVGLSGVLNLAGWLYLCRIGIIGLAILFAIPALARGGARALLLGGFELQTSLDGFGVGALLLLSGWTVFIVCTLVLEYGAERTGWILGEAPPKVRRFLRLAIAGMVLFNCWTAISATFPPNREGVTKGLATGVLVALGLIAATEEGYIRLGVKRDITWADFYLFPRKKPVGLTDHRLYSDPTHEAGADSELVWLSRGYLPLGTGRRNLIDLATSPKLPGHGYAAGLLVLWAVIYGVGWYWVRYSCPLTTLFYLLIIFNVGIWLLSGLAFFFDAYRVPVLLLLAGWFAITGSSADSDHCYRIFPAIRPMSAPGPADILGKALKNHQHIVVVATAGGGIQATAWTARVLTGLEETRAKRGHPGDFASSVQLLSGVSGGSTGLMFFVQAYGPGGLAPPGQAPPSSQPLNPALLEAVNNAAQSTSLGRVVYGMAYPDLHRALFPWGESSFYDRGEMLENTWISNGAKLTGAGRTLDETTLGDWQQDAAKGIRPAIIFNATSCETGMRFAFSTAPCLQPFNGEEEFNSPTSSNPGPAGSGAEPLYPNADILMATAARLSSSFPYISPVARPEPTDNENLGLRPPRLPEPERDRVITDARGRLTPPEHLADGGYFDNSGLTALDQWLHEGLDGIGWNVSPKDILVIEIVSFPEGQPPIPEERGTLFQTEAPLATLYNVRGAGHESFAQNNFKLLQDLAAAKNVRLRPYRFVLPLLPAKTAIDRRWWWPAWANAEPDVPPLSWHLRQVEKAAIENDWEYKDTQDVVTNVMAALDGRP